MCTISTTNLNSFVGGDDGGLLPVIELLSQLFSIDATFVCIFTRISIHSFLSSIIFSVSVGSSSTIRNWFMLTAYCDTQVKFCSNWATPLFGDTN